MIEVDIQLLIRILINTRNKFRIEKDNGVSKSNYRLWLYYSLENSALEKRLVYNNSLLAGNHNIYNMTDLQACYDRQLVQIELIVWELVGVERKQIKLLTKILLIIEYYMCESFKVSKKYYREHREK